MIKPGAGEDFCHLTFVCGRYQKPPTQSSSPQGFASSLCGVNRLDLFPFCAELKIKLPHSKCPLASCLPSISRKDWVGIMTSASCVFIKKARIYNFKFSIIFPCRVLYSRLSPPLLSVLPIFQVKQCIEAPQMDLWGWLSLWLQGANDLLKPCGHTGVQKAGEYSRTTANLYFLFFYGTITTPFLRLAEEEVDD